MERYHIFKLGLAIIFYAAYCIRPMVVTCQRIDDNANQTKKFTEEDLVFYQGVEGKPGVDFPIFSHIPRTSFSCRDVESGYYADLETDCQVFHICEENKKISFLCPNGTIFQQSELICEWWFKVNCTNSPNLYEESAEQLREENARRKLSRRVKNHGAVMRMEERSSVSKSRNRERTEKKITKIVNNNIDNDKNDLSKSSSSDFVRSEKTKNQRGRKPVQFQQPPSVDKEERPPVRKVVHRIKKPVNNNRETYQSTSKTFENNQETTTTQKKNQQHNSYIEQTTQTYYPANIKNSTEKNRIGATNQQSLNNHRNQKFATPDRTPFQNGHQHFSSDTQNYNNHNYQNTEVNEKKTTPIFNPANYVYYNTNYQGSTTTKSVTSQRQGFFREERKFHEEFDSEPTSQRPNNVFNFSPNQQKNLSKYANHRIDNSESNTLSDQRENESNEAQITQETSSFYKNSYNRIQNEGKTTNPYPNHRETYSELKEPRYYSTRIFSAISSVTPQYLTTQPINRGRPFVGSQVGTTLKNFVNSTQPYFATTTAAPSTNFVPTELFNIGRTDKSLRPFTFSTSTTFVPKPINITVPSHGSFNLGTTVFKTESSTPRVIDHATVYGTFAKPISTKASTLPISTPKPVTVPSTTSKPKPSTTSGPSKIQLSLSKSVFGSTNSVSKSSAEILTASDSYNRGNNQVRFYGQVKSDAKTQTPKVEIGVNGNSLSTTKFNSGSSNFGSSTVLPLSLSTLSPYTTTFNSFNSLSPGKVKSSTNFKSKSTNFVSSTAAPINTFVTFNNEFTTPPPKTTTLISTTLNPTSYSYITTGTEPKVNGFFITKSQIVPTPKSRLSDIIRPRPFQLPPEPTFGKVYTTETPSTPAPTYPVYKISSASPFVEPSTPEPTTPTPFTTAKPTLPSTFENVDSMVNALANIASQNFSDDPRPGLVIPPSVGPQTLHTLAVYFANALDGITVEKEEDEEVESNENLTKLEMEKKKLTELLTQMTMDRYNELFEDKIDTTTVTTTVASDKDDLEGQHSKGPVQSTKVRQLAKVFTQALSSYLDDPVTFRKVLQEIRPTEPPPLEEETSDSGDDELLNFSDADSKSSYPPFYPTLPSARPTWGYLVAYNTSHNLDVKNSLNPEKENLQGADSQSFISQFNKLQRESTTKSSIQLPNDHWTSSPDVDKLWKNTFAFDPASINENFGTTEAILTTTEETEKTIVEDHHEIKYELKALPQLDLNSTQVHGILIDFMNTTKNDDQNRLQRILRKLNTTEDEFLSKMKEIESNPLTRRLILLLINECDGKNKTEATVAPIQELLTKKEILDTSSSVSGFRHEETKKPSGFQIVDPTLTEDTHDARALQLLNSLYTIASRFGK